MHTIEDEKNIKEYEKYILRNGIDRSVIDAYCEASKLYFAEEKTVNMDWKFLQEQKN